jgi:hypothetical protein
MAARSKAHKIKDISYGPNGGPSWSLCTCGESLSGDSPSALEAAWATHSGNRTLFHASLTPTPPASKRPSHERCAVGGCDVRRDRCILHRPETAKPTNVSTILIGVTTRMDKVPA